MNESVTISLDRYNEYLFYKEKFEKLQTAKEGLIEILNDTNFDLENKLHKKIYDVYENILK